MQNGKLARHSVPELRHSIPCVALYARETNSAKTTTILKSGLDPELLAVKSIETRIL